MVEPPDLPELEPPLLGRSAGDGDLVLEGALVEHQGAEPVCARRINVTESELRGVVLVAGDAPGVQLIDVVLRDCDLSNVNGREGSVRRVEIHDSRLVGFGLAGGTVQDVRVVNSSLALASFAFSELRDVVFEQVSLAEASFMEAHLAGVEFVDCELDGADFRGASLTRSAIRGTALDGVLGVDCLHGITMPWQDVLASARAMAAALGITVDWDEH